MIRINQSLIKKFLFRGDTRDYCPKMMYEIIYNKVKTETTLSMAYGKYFETRCLGSGAGGDTLDDLPRKKLTKEQVTYNEIQARKGEELVKGNKTVAQLRIEAQAEVFDNLIKKYQIQINNLNTQVKICKVWKGSKDVILEGELDIFPTSVLSKAGLKLAIIDLKLTADISSRWGEYCWGAPEHLDDIQSKMYQYLIKDIDIGLNEEMNPGNHLKEILTQSCSDLIRSDQIIFLFWVFAHKKIENKFIKITNNSLKEAELHESIRKTYEYIRYHNDNGWDPIPEFSICKNCPVKDCKDKEEVETI